MATHLFHVAIAALLLQWGLVASVFPDLPDRVPRHFDASGQADAWGPRMMVWSLPIVNVAIFVLLGVVSRLPHLCAALVGARGG